MQDGRGQCGQEVRLGAEKSAGAGTNCRVCEPAGRQKSPVLLGFSHGMAFAEELA
jgi:hypothetical protein